MYFILQELQKDLGDTPIENIFINDFMPFAEGTYVKVYLMGYKCARDKQSNFNNETIAKNLNLELVDVLEAWDYWENEGIIKKHLSDDNNNYIVEFVNLKQLYVETIYKSIDNENKEKSHYVNNEELILSSKNSENIKMMEEIEEMFGRPLVPSEKRKINEWLVTYKMKPEIMAQAFSYALYNRNISKFPSIEKKVIKDWFDAGVKDLDTMMEYLEKRNDRYSIYSRISKYLGIYRPLDVPTMRTIDKWIDDWDFTMDMIFKCLDKSVNTLNPNFTYFDSILEKWYKQGFKTIDDLKNDIKPEVKAKTTVKETPKTKNKFHNFIQSDDLSNDDLEKIARKRFEKKLNKLGLNMPDEGESHE